MYPYRPNIYDPLPVKIVEGDGCWVKDETGRTYLDCLAAYSALSHGHNNKAIIAAAKAQMDKLCLTSRAFDPPILATWEHKMCMTFDSKMVIPMNSGAEAVETAIKCARKWGNKVKGVTDGSQKIIVCDGNFHGRTTTIVSFSPNANYREGFGPLTPGFITIPYNDIAYLEYAITDNTVAFLVEPLQGEGGMNVPDKGYLSSVRDICTKHSVLLILDEVQTGLGRTGYLLAEEYDGVEADITCLGKALGGGIVPISATLDRRGDIMNLLGPGDHGSTWGGNPLACAVSLKAIEVMFGDNLIPNSKAIGAYLLDEFLSMGLNARGRGLMIGIVPPDGVSAREICLMLMREGVLTKDSHGVIRITPPLCITIAEARYLVETVRKVFNKGVKHV